MIQFGQVERFVLNGMWFRGFRYQKILGGSTRRPLTAMRLVDAEKNEFNEEIMSTYNKL